MPYLYVGNNTINYIDPNGTDTCHYDIFFNLLNIEKSWLPSWLVSDSYLIHTFYYRDDGSEITYGDKFGETTCNCPVRHEIPQPVYDENGNLWGMSAATSPSQNGLEDAIGPEVFFNGGSLRALFTRNSAEEIAGAESFFEGTYYSKKVVHQMDLGDYHAFPESVTSFGNIGTKSITTGGDGIKRATLRIYGAYRNKEGVFEFMKENNKQINHRLFKENKK